MSPELQKEWAQKKLGLKKPPCACVLFPSSGGLKLNQLDSEDEAVAYSVKSNDEGSESEEAVAYDHWASLRLTKMLGRGKWQKSTTEPLPFP